MTLRQVDLSMDIIASSFALGVEPHLALLHASCPLRRDEPLLGCPVELSPRAAEGASGATAEWLTEGIYQRLAHLAEDALVLVGVQQVLGVVGRERLEHGAEGPGPAAPLLQRAQGLQLRAEVLLVRRTPVGQVAPVARPLVPLAAGFPGGVCGGRALRGVVGGRRLLVRLQPRVRLLPPSAVPVVDLGARHVQGDLQRHGVEELRVHARGALLDALLDLDEHALKLPLGLRGQELVDLRHDPVGHPGAEAVRGPRLQVARLLALLHVGGVLAHVEHGLPELLVLRVVLHEDLYVRDHVLHLGQAHLREELVRGLVEDRHVLKLGALRDLEALRDEVDGPLAPLLDADQRALLRVHQVEALFLREPLAVLLVVHLFVVLEPLLLQQQLLNLPLVAPLLHMVDLTDLGLNAIDVLLL
mmetsp:Transcript_31073/g.87525  ORF Transcript_31073/g.87525 Transcript_31073/m.87525 type:complete len:416 (-) Transcript_31073:170-1417(-)